jgi:hypothetical protein
VVLGAVLGWVSSAAILAGRFPCWRWILPAIWFGFILARWRLDLLGVAGEPAEIVLWVFLVVLIGDIVRQRAGDLI